MLRLTLLCLLVAVSIAADTISDAQKNIENTMNEVTTTKDGALYCPMPLVGTQCPSSSFFHYYKCCGDLNKDCCFNLQTWVIVVLAIVAVIFLASVVLSIVRCICCRR